ncbi:protein SEC13 homolog [Metopolophium dirhodum]|uniref:protein SEC13 homolog n=1 Tax=Metopolophium dirhodum TaxID=44670 RepID=UPI00298FF7BE|nr:protein SEC13 homolog [Metopolophium dirhodum]
MLSVASSFETIHKGQILSTDIDYYNKYVCTSSTDGVIQIIDSDKSDLYAPVIQLQEHVGPVWQVRFSHPKFGFLASCGSDCQLIIRKTNDKGEWKVVYQYDGHKSSTTSIDWAPYKSGAIIACSSVDGTISIHALNNNDWCVSKIPNAHVNGVNCISWSNELFNNNLLLVSGGNDNKIKIWQGQIGMWNVKYESDNQLSTIKDISWSPTPGLYKHVFASCASNGRVFVWGSDDCFDWAQTEIDPDNMQKQKISFSRFGTVLSVTMNSYAVQLWKQIDKQTWMCMDNSIANRKTLDRQNKNVNQDIFASIA